MLQQLLRNGPNKCRMLDGEHFVRTCQIQASYSLRDGAQRIWTVLLPRWRSVIDQPRGGRPEATVRFRAPGCLTPCHCDRLPQWEARLRPPLPKPSLATVLCTQSQRSLRKLVITTRGAVSRRWARHKQYYLREGAEQALNVTQERLQRQRGNCDAQCQCAPLR